MEMNWYVIFDNSGDSRTTLIGHYHSPLLHFAWNFTHYVGEICSDIVPMVLPCYGTPQRSKDVQLKQLTNVSIRINTALKQYQKLQSIL